MKTTVLNSVLIVLVLMLGGCSAPDQYGWIPWQDFRGHCALEMTITIDSQPPDAEVFVDGVYKGTTPYTLEYETSSYIAGQKRNQPQPNNVSRECETRNTRFLEETAIEIMVAKQGYQAMSTTIIAQDHFRSDSLRHGKRYEKAINLNYSLETEGWGLFHGGSVETIIGQPAAAP